MHWLQVQNRSEPNYYKNETHNCYQVPNTKCILYDDQGFQYFAYTKCAYSLVVITILQFMSILDISIAHKQKERLTYRGIDMQTNTHRQIDRQIYRQTDRWTDKQINCQTDIYRWIEIYCFSNPKNTTITSLLYGSCLSFHK